MKSAIPKMHTGLSARVVNQQHVSLGCSVVRGSSWARVAGSSLEGALDGRQTERFPFRIDGHSRNSQTATSCRYGVSPLRGIRTSGSALRGPAQGEESSTRNRAFCRGGAILFGDRSWATAPSPSASDGQGGARLHGARASCRAYHGFSRTMSATSDHVRATLDMACTTSAPSSRHWPSRVSSVSDHHHGRRNAAWRR